MVEDQGIVRKLHPASVVVLVLGLLVLGLQAWHYWPYLSDDGLISLRYAERLAGGEGLTWSAGARVEGYSNLLWTALLAVPVVVGLDPLVGLRGLCFMSAAAVVVAVWWPWRGRPLAALVAVMAVGMDGTLGVWALGGLEQPLLAALLAVATGSLGAALQRQDRTCAAVFPAAVALALACWTRPDTPLLVAALALGWWLAQGQDRTAFRGAVVLAVVPAAATLLQVAGRWLYYGDWVPNTAHVKLLSGESHVDLGVMYLVDGVEAHAGLLLLASLSLVVAPPGEVPRARLRLLLPLLVVWPTYLVCIGGDIFPAQRHLVVWVAVLAGLAAAGVAGLPRLRVRVQILVALGVLALLGAQWSLQQERISWSRLRFERWVLEGLEVGAWLRERFGHTGTTLAISPAGAVPYAWKGPSLDMLGLNDAHIARQPPVRGWIGHAHGDGDYVLAQRPGLILFCGPRGSDHPCFRSEQELVALDGFLEGYRLLTAQTASGIPVSLWVDQQNPAVWAAAVQPSPPPPP